MDEDTSYLEPDFDPFTLTAPRLRSILVAHNVAYPSSAKKPDLVQLFNDNVASQAKKIRTAQSKTKRSTKGIVNVSPGGNPVNGSTHDDEDELAPLQTPARKTSRKTGRAVTDELTAPTPRTSRSTRQSTAPAVGRAYENLDGAQDELEVPRTRRTRGSMSPVKREKSSSRLSDDAVETAFTQDNPFQSGSPTPGLRSKSIGRRRTTQGATSDEDATTGQTLNHRAEKQVAKRERSLRTPARLPTPGGQHSPIKIEDDDDIPITEEFAPDQELEDALAGHGTVARRVRQPRSQAAKVTTVGGLLTALLAVGAGWRHEKLNVGYCGIGEPTTTVANTEIPEWFDTMRPQCEPCPQHAYCYAGLKTVCEPDFVLTPHPLSFGGAIPLSPTCEPDGAKARKVKAVADFAVDKELRERNAQYECGEVKTPEIPIEELKTTVSKRRSRKMSDEEFDDLWESALGEIMGRDEVETHGTGSDIYVRSTSLARVPLGCAIRRSVRTTAKQHISKLVGLILAVASAFYGRHALVVRRSTSARAKLLAASALGKLASQASLHAEEPDVYPENWVSMVSLRDDVLRDEFNAKERARVWDVVRGLVEGNGNVRSMVRESRTGEVSRAWEWIGPVERIESPDAGINRRKSGARYSLGPATGSAPGTPGRDGGGMKQVSRWTEGNSSYF